MLDSIFWYWFRWKSWKLIQRESAYVSISRGELYCLENSGKIDVVLIGAQVGSYLGENDIVRIEKDIRK